MTATDYCVVLVTVPPGGGLPPLEERLAKGLVESRLAACVNRLPGIRSHYEWEGKPEESSETLLIIKTRLSLFASVARYVKDNHPAKIPEIIALPLADAEAAYLDWLGANTRFSKPLEKPKLPL